MSLRALWINVLNFRSVFSYQVYLQELKAPCYVIIMKSLSLFQVVEITLKFISICLVFSSVHQLQWRYWLHHLFTPDADREERKLSSCCRYFILTKYKLNTRNYYLNWNSVTLHAVEWVSNWQTQRVTKQTRQVYQCFSLVGSTTKNKRVWLSWKLTAERFPYNIM